MSTSQYRSQNLPKFNFVFNSEQSQIIDTAQSFPIKEKKFMYFQTQNESIIFSDLMLLWEYGHLKEKLSIQGYVEFENLIKSFISEQKAKQTFLNYCLIQYQRYKNSILSKIVLTVNYSTIMEQYEELLPKIQQFVDQDKGKDLNAVLNSAFLIYSKLTTHLQNMQQLNDLDLMCSIQKRFFIKQYLQQKTKQDEKYQGYFKEINELLKKMKAQQQYQIFDILIEADAETLEQVYYFMKNQQAIQFKFVQQENNIIKDLDLNNYYLSSLYIADAIISDQTIVQEWQEQDKNKYIQDKFNEIINGLEGYEITLQENTNQQDKRFIKFKEALINQLKIKFWIFEVELTENIQDDKLNNHINKLFNKYYKSICLKLPFNNLLEKLIKIIVDDNRMEGIIERILELKIQKINKYVLDLIEKHNLIDIDKKLEQIYQKRRGKYLKQLKNQPILRQQVDIIINYCNKIIQITEMENSKAIVDFTNPNQRQILENYLIQEFPNYEILNADGQLSLELFQQTNKYCPDLSILFSTQFVIYKQNFFFKGPKQENKINAVKQQQQEKVYLKCLDYGKLDIQKIIQQGQIDEQLPSVLYENRIWDQHHKKLISECTKYLDQQMIKIRNQRLDEKKKKLKEENAKKFLIPFEWIEQIIIDDFDNMKEDDDTIVKIQFFFVKVKEDEEKHLKELQEYVEFDDDNIKNRNNQIKEYFNTLDKKNYKTIEELEADVRNEIQTNRQQQFRKQYEIKNSIDKIETEYIKQCYELLNNPPTNFKKCKFDKETQSNDLMDIKNKIMSFYGQQLINHLKQQLEQ